MGKLRAGVARVNLTPAIGSRLLGFIGRLSGCTSIHDDLYATALVLDDGNERIAVVSCDILSISPRIVAKVRNLVEDAVSIPSGNVMISCTHTHSGPVGYVSESSAEIDRTYAEYLPFRLASAIRLAQNNLIDASIGYGGGEIAIGVNRRETTPDGKTILGENPDGPVDLGVHLLRLDAEDGSPIATLLNYACHPVILGVKSLAVSADYVGRTREVVENATGAPMLFLQGACGDINPKGGVQADYTNCHSLGTILAGEALRVYASIANQQADVHLASYNTALKLAMRSIPERDFERMRDLSFLHTTDASNGNVGMEVQAFALGDLAIVATACEPFVETGLVSKESSPFSHTLFAGYTNGCIGYVPTADAFPKGGYEVSVSLVEPEAEQLVVRECGYALKQVFGATGS